MRGSLKTGALSPVSEDSATRQGICRDQPGISADGITLVQDQDVAAAPMPRTGTVFSSRSRSTVEFAAVITRSAATAVSALFSWTKPRTPLNSDHGPDHDRVNRHAGGTFHRPGKDGDGDGRQQQVDQRVLELPEDLPPQRHRRCGRSSLAP